MMRSDKYGRQGQLIVLSRFAKDSTAAKWNAADFYPEHEEELFGALTLTSSPFTTGVYSVHKDMVSARVERQPDRLVVVEVWAGNDFDAEGYSRSYVGYDAGKHAVVQSLLSTQEDAEANLADNSPDMLIVRRGQDWVGTYIAPTDGYDIMRGDFYTEFGWQDGTKIPNDIRNELEDNLPVVADAPYSVGEYTVTLVT